MSYENSKKTAGYLAVDYIKNNMIVGLGTGSTVFFFVEKLIEKVRNGLQIQAVSSSMETLELAKKGGIPLLDINKIEAIDITVDGADQIDPQGNMIKGGGGALFREKMVASLSKNVLIIVDQSKVVKSLGNGTLPVEILPFAILGIINRINDLGFKGKIRLKKEDPFTYFITDNGNYIFDISLKSDLANPLETHQKLIGIPGVCETGLFLNVADQAIIGYENGETKTLL